MSPRYFVAPLLVLAACGGTSQVTLTVIAPDGGDPFLGPDAATTAVIRFDDNGATQPVNHQVDATGGFTWDVQPSSATEQSRLIIEAYRGSELVGSGATPPIEWAGVEGHSAAILMHRRDSLIPAPSSFSTGRAEFRLQPFNEGFVAAITVPHGASEAPVVEYYDLLAHVVGRELQTVPPLFDQDTTIIPVADEWILINGSDHYAAYTNDPMLPVSTDIPAPPVMGANWAFTQPAAATEVDDPNAPEGGGWLVGGHDANGVPSNIVDHLQKNSDATFGWSAPPTMLATGRDRPDVIVLTQATATASPLWLVVGGQSSATDRVLEIYSPSGVPAVQPSLISVTPRTDVTAVCTAYDGLGCTAALVLGGRDAMGHPVSDDLLVDGVRARAGDTGCVTVLSMPMFSHRRFAARAALAEGGRVLIAGGHDASSATDAVYDAESIDVTTALMPQPGRIVATLTNADPAVLATTAGSVMLAGGRHMDGSAGTEVWFYRY